RHTLFLYISPQSYTHVTLNVVPFSMSDVTLMLASRKRRLPPLQLVKVGINYDSSKQTIDDWEKA
ncbi:hypothetical protein, partial [Prevotella sp.]|uniref:hypothetical protein n=1 Tax=Prevotella sp. TaxID=59823 RepID=UPI0025F47302